jgi:hypothetical protein
MCTNLSRIKRRQKTCGTESWKNFANIPTIRCSRDDQRSKNPKNTGKLNELHRTRQIQVKEPFEINNHPRNGRNTQQKNSTYSGKKKNTEEITSPNILRWIKTAPGIKICRDPEIRDMKPTGIVLWIQEPIYGRKKLQKIKMTPRINIKNVSRSPETVKVITESKTDKKHTAEH